MSRAGRTVPKLLIFGIDGGDLALAETLVARGRLPNLARLFERGTRAQLTCTRPAHTAPGWASLVTAQPPGEHGIYQFFDVQEPAYRARVVRSDDFRCATMWDWVTASGLSVGLVNIPMSHPPRGYEGYEITWPLRNTLHFASPPGVLGQLAACGCAFRSDLACMYRGDPRYVAFALENVKARASSVRHLMRSRPTDVVMAVVTEVDRICHHYWHYADPSHPAFYADAPAPYRTAIEDVYVAVDAALGEVVRDVPAGVPIVVVSDHGSTAGHDSFSVHRLLERNGLLTTRERSEPSERAPWFADGKREIDFTRTSAYVPVPGSYGVNLNLRGRQRHGVVPPHEAERLIADLRALLLAVRSPRTGEPIFADVVPREAAYPGGAMDRAPDLALIPADERVMASTHLEGEDWEPSRQTGHHRYEGMWLHASPDARAARLSHSVRITDVAPTALAEIDVAVPGDVEGRVVGEAFRAPRRAAGAPARAARKTALPSDAEDHRLEDRLVTQRLRAMGYL